MVGRRSTRPAHQQSFIEIRYTHTHKADKHGVQQHTHFKSKVKELLNKLQKFDAFRFKYTTAQQYIEDRMNMDITRLSKIPKNPLT